MTAILILTAIFMFTPMNIFAQEGQMEIKSNAFENEGMIPVTYTCDGQDISPQLSWSGAPVETKSFVLIADDPDAPAGTWVHWVIYNIPPTVKELNKNIPNDAVLPGGITQGMTDFGRTGYGGPCPPGGTHRYYFKLYALNEDLGLKPKLSKKEVLKKINAHIIGEAELMGKYSRK